MSPTTVKMPYERKVHILDNNNKPLCGVDIKPNSVFKNWLFERDKICPKCLQIIGSIMVVDYVGQDNFLSRKIHLNGGKEE